MTGCCRQSVPQLLGVPGVQVDLILGAVQPEADRPLDGAAVGSILVRQDAARACGYAVTGVPGESWERWCLSCIGDSAWRPTAGCASEHQDEPVCRGWTVWAKRPLAVLEYPVFKRFVRHHIPHYISLGDTEQLRRLSGKFAGLHQLRDDVLDAAVTSAIALLIDHDLERSWADENFTVLRAFCGIDIVAAQYLRLYAELRGNGRP
jgi:hypothetical protein